MIEIWATVPMTNGLYESSNIGNIRRVLGKVRNNKHGGTRSVGGNNLSQKTKSNGYKEVNLYVGGNKNKMTYVHRAVYSAFNGCISEGFQINHIDGDKSNNKLSNLELVSASENMRHAFHNKLSTVPVMNGESHPMSKLSSSQVACMREEYFVKRNITELSIKFNVSKSTVVRIVSNKSWVH
jgi:hypothetical protein